MAAVTAHDRLARLPALVNGDDAAVRRGRFLSIAFLLGVDDVEYLITVSEGRIASVERGPFLMRPWRFALRATGEVWLRFWEAMPAPGYHDLFAMKKRGVARVEGDIVPLMTHLRYVQDVITAPRRAGPAHG
jgi:hypothetical protein